MSEDSLDQPETGFSAEYVKQLREENAGWRRKVRELEATQTEVQVAMEFAKRGISADPKWLKIPEGVSPGEAVDQFLASFPQPAQPAEDEPQDRQYPPQPLIPNSNTPGVPGPPAQGVFGGRSLEEIKKDPKARAMLREQYRNLLRDTGPENYFS